MIHDIINNSSGQFGLSPKIYPALIKHNSGTVLAVFTQHQMEVAIKRGKRFPELSETLKDKIEKERSKNGLGTSGVE